MTTVLLIMGIWFLLLAVFVALKARQPKLTYPKPPRLVTRSPSRPYAA